MLDNGDASSVKSPELEGILVYVMGASGVGKDTLIARIKDELGEPAEASALPESAVLAGPLRLRPLHIAQRRITRPFKTGGELHCAMDEPGFQRALAEGEFVMHWQSHGLMYGIGKEIDRWLSAGGVVIVNGSREYLPVAQKIYPDLVPVLVHVNSDDLRRRLLERGRETHEQIEARLARAQMGIPDVDMLVLINNSGHLEKAVAVFARLINTLRSSAPQRRSASLYPSI